MKQDQKLVAYQQKYEVADICRTWKKMAEGKLVAIKKADLLALVALLPHRHSKKEVEACLIGSGYVKVPRKRKTNA